MRASRRWGTGLLIFCLPACDRPAPDAPPPPPEAAVAERPATIARPIAIEGMQDTLQFRLVRSPDGFPLPFSTYVPDDMDAEFDAIETGHIANFPARFGGVRNDRARMTFHVYPAGTPPERARTDLAAYLSGLYPDDTPLTRDAAYERATPVEPASRYAWAQDESRYHVPGGAPGLVISGRAGSAEHAGHVFYFLIEFPAEYGDGMGPRVEAILDEWRWADTGGPLGG